MDLHLLAPAFVDDQLRVDGYAAVVGPFRPGEVEDEEEGGEGDDAAGGGADAGVFDGFGEGVQAGESGLGWHYGGDCGAKAGICGGTTDTGSN